METFTVSIELEAVKVSIIDIARRMKRSPDPALPVCADL